MAESFVYDSVEAAIRVSRSVRSNSASEQPKMCRTLEVDDSLVKAGF